MLFVHENLGHHSTGKRLMNTLSISAIIPVRNRSGVRLENCLRSLRWQALDRDALEIIISDFGSNPEHLRSTEALAETYGATVVKTKTDETWNRSKALNIGIQAASAPLLFCTDVDMIFQDTFIPTILKTHDSSDSDAMVLCRCRDLPESVPEQLWEAEDFATLKAASSIRQTRGTGACQAALKSFFVHTRGYDEKFVYWGAEDVDMTSRAQRFGLRLLWMDDDVTCMLHQWHPTVKHDRKWTFQLNRLRFKLTKRIIVKNRHGWGAIDG